MTLPTLFVAYDIADDDARARVAAILSTTGVRKQRSVFQCAVDEPDVSDLIQAVRGQLDDGTDRLLVLTECAQCRDRRHEFGQPETHLLSRFWVV